MSFVKVKLDDSDEILLNLEHIIKIESYRQYYSVWLTDGRFLTLEPAEAAKIFEKIGVSL